MIRGQNSATHLDRKGIDFTFSMASDKPDKTQREDKWIYNSAPTHKPSAASKQTNKGGRKPKTTASDTVLERESGSRKLKGENGARERENEKKNVLENERKIGVYAEL